MRIIWRVSFRLVTKVIQTDDRSCLAGGPPFFRIALGLPVTGHQGKEKRENGQDKKEV
jgi:hypothetical protein